MIDIAAACRAVLSTAEPRAKVRAARATARDWRAGRINWAFDAVMPDHPARPPRPEHLPPGRMPKRGRAGSLRGRIAMLHAIAHIEFVAIDLAIDMAGRFGGQFPRAFVDDWLGVAAQEAMHFALMDRRLRTLGAGYGELPVHGGLWDTAERTVDDALARLATVPMVLEARGLDVTPAMVERFEAAGDARSAAILRRILSDEIGHVATGVRWFQYQCGLAGFEPRAAFIDIVSERLRGVVRPPFNASARTQAGLPQDFYHGVATID